MAAPTADVCTSLTRRIRRAQSFTSRTVSTAHWAAPPGDTLFGAGGSLQFRNLVDSPAGLGLNLTLGSGADTIYARPQTTVTTSIDAGDPTSGAGDTLNLLLSQAQNARGPKYGGWRGQCDQQQSQADPMDRHRNAKFGNAVAPTGLLVVNTLDSGPGSLRQAILDANATPNVGGPDVIRFSIPGAGAHYDSTTFAAAWHQRPGRDRRDDAARLRRARR